MKYIYSKKGDAISLGVKLSKDDTDAGIYEYFGIAWSLNMDFKMPLDSTIYARFAYSSSDYAEQETLAPYPRKDTQNQATIGVSKTFKGRAGVDANYQRTRNNSTFALYQYDRDVVSVSMFAVF